MPFTLSFPKLSPTMESGTIVKWYKQEGEYVESGELLLEIATDKATVEYNALDEGWLRKILVASGQEANVNSPIAIFTEQKDESFTEHLPKTPQKDTVMTTPKDAPQVAPPQHEKVSVVRATTLPEPALKDYQFPFPLEGHQKRTKASPLARRLAEDKKLDLSSVRGTGPGGRIVSGDLNKAQTVHVTSSGRREYPKALPGSYEEEPISPIRKFANKRLQESKMFVPHFYVSQEIQAQALVEMRAQLKELEVKLTFNDFVIRAVALALRECPALNSGYHNEHETVIRFKTVDIAVAVSVEGGLLTPIIRCADFKTVSEIAVELRELAQRAHAGKLAREEYMGGSFTISNLGMYGVTDFVAVINPPQAAILAVSAIEQRPMIKDGQVLAGHAMNVTLSIDHRVVDGAAAAGFIKTVQKYLENPVSLLL